MANIRRTFLSGRINKDSDSRLLQDGEYIHAENIIVLDSEGSDVGTVQNSLPNRKITNLNLGANPICLGGYSDEATQKLYWAIKSDLGCYVLEYDAKNNVTSKILEDTRSPGVNRVLDFKETHLITAFNKIISEDSTKDLLVINDDNLQPLCFNIERAKTYGLNGFDKEDIFLIKKPPRFAPITTPTFVVGASNYIEEKFLSFSYRYKYLDGEYSALSSYSNYVFYPKKFELDYEVLDNIGMLNSYNAVRLTINTGDKRVTDIQCVVKSSSSNILYIIETFNKKNEGWGDDVDMSFVFSNSKIYIPLPEKELYRSYDAVPLKAKAQTVIGNKIIMGNFLEGYNLIDKNNNKVKLDYSLSILSKSLEGDSIPYSFNLISSIVTINFAGFNLKSGSKINLYFSINSFYLTQHNPALLSKNYNQNHSFILTKNYLTASELAQDVDFIFFINTYLTNLFLDNYTINTIPNSELESNTGFQIQNFTTTTISIITPSLIFRVDDTPANSGDNPANTHLETVNWFFDNTTSVLFYEDGNISSLKSNRSLEVGFVYMDGFNRQTTVLTQLNNTVFIPHEKALSRNKLKISLSSSFLPPAFADRYKIAIKQQSLNYQTIYATLFYIEGLFRWIKLENDNKDKVKVGDILIFKSDTNGFVETLKKVKVLEIVSKDKGFIEGNADSNGNLIEEIAGLYMKIKVPTGISMDYIADGFLEFKGSTANYGGNFHVYIGGFSKNINGVFVDVPIVQGARIDIYLKNDKFGSDGGLVEFKKTYFASQDYIDFESFYNTEVNNNTSPFADPTNGVVRGAMNGFTINPSFVENVNGQLYLKIRNELNGNGQHRSYLDGDIRITAPNGLIILETEEKKSIESEIYYETEQTFEIINGFHQGNLPSVSNGARIELDFFNCFCQGNGAESYIVKDAFNKPFLNIDLRPSAVSIEEYKQVRRYADLIYSESYIESSNINGLNVFNTATGNFKELDKQYGSIQKLHSRDNDILVLKEYKASQVMFEKDLLTNSDGTTNVTTTNRILSKERPYMGDNGIGKNPESFAENDFRIYYANSKQGSVVRLSIDGVTPIVNGMIDWFKDIFRLRPNAKKLGGIDPYTKQYFISIGEEPIKRLLLNCGNEIIKDNQTLPFTYELQLNDLSGDIILNYNITNGNATIEAVFNGFNYVASNVNGIGNLTFTRDSLVENIVTITITPVGGAISYLISNVCPIGSELKIVSIIVNDAEDLTKNAINGFRWGQSNNFTTNDIFDGNPVSKFLTEIGTEGVGKYPLNNSIITLQSNKNNLSTGAFLTNECNRLGYLISSTIYQQANIDTILSAATFLDITETEEVGYDKLSFGSFLFNRNQNNEILYLIWDYTNRKPILLDDTANVALAGTVVANVLSNDQVVNNNIVLTIDTPPIYGTAIVNLDKTISYTHNGTDNFDDFLIYKVTNGNCSSTAKLSVQIGVSCSASINPNGGTGIYDTVINLGTGAGLSGIKYNSLGVPDRFELFYNNIKVADSKYVGDSISTGPPTSYAGLLGVKTGFSISNWNGTAFVDSQNIEPDFTVIQSDIANNTTEATDGNGTLLFNKTTATPTTLRIRVTGNSSATGWNFKGICPIPNQNLITGADKIVWGFYTELNKGLNTKSMKFFLGSSPVKFYTNIRGDVDFSEFNNLAANPDKRWVNDGVNWWQLDAVGNILSTGLI